MVPVLSRTRGDGSTVIAYLLIGLGSGLLAGLFGLGGGIVVVPALLWTFAGQDVADTHIAHLAIGTSLASIIGTGTASVYAHHRRHAVRWEVVIQLTPWIILGAAAGAWITSRISAFWVQRIFALFLCYIGFRLLLAPNAPQGHRTPNRIVMALAGTGIGGLSALVGIGGGTLTVPFLTRGGLDIRQAVATSSACGLPIAFAGSLGFIVAGWHAAGLPSGATGYVFWPAVAGIVLASMPAAPLGARLAHTLPTVWLKRLFAIIVLLVAIKLIV